MTPEPDAAPTRPTREQLRAVIAGRPNPANDPGDQWLVQSPYDSVSGTFWNVDVDGLTDAVMALLAGEGTPDERPTLVLHLEQADGEAVWWAESDHLPGFTACAPSLAELRTLVAEAHPGVDFAERLVAGEGTAQPDQPLDLETLAEATAMIEGGTTEDHLERIRGELAITEAEAQSAIDGAEFSERLRASGEGTAPQPAGLVQCGWLQTYDDPDAPPGPLYALDSDPEGHADDAADEQLVPVYRLAERGTAPQVPAEVLWEGETTRPQIGVGTGSAVFKYLTDVPPGTRVRVVAADGAPQEGDERG